jgi:hypothetical protein
LEPVSIIPLTRCSCPTWSRTSIGCSLHTCPSVSGVSESSSNVSSRMGHNKGEGVGGERLPEVRSKSGGRSQSSATGSFWKKGMCGSSETFAVCVFVPMVRKPRRVKIAARKLMKTTMGRQKVR